MPNPLGALRMLAPSLASVSFAGRGFPVEPTPATARLELIPQSVVCGFEWGAADRSQATLVRRLDMVEPELRGFAYEGAVMALTISDTIHGSRTRELMLGPAQPHVFLSYIGIGFAMARLPRFLWRKVLPDLSGAPYYPVMSWLAVDGYAFDRAYFDTRRWVERQYVPPPYPWLGDAEYFPRAVDQGVGRALWFIHGARSAAVAAAVERFAEHRRADLWSGVGLAAAMAGGCRADELADLASLCGPHSPQLALGAVFAVNARLHAGYVPEHTAQAVDLLAGMTPESALLLAAETAVGEAEAAPGQAYELWRRRIREQIKTGA